MRARGVTLLELIIVMVVLGIVAAVVGRLIFPAVQSYFALSRRAALVDAAESSLRRMARDVRIAVPNSVRVTMLVPPASGFALELVPTADGGRYCVAGEANCNARPPNAAFNNLGVGAADTDFSVLGCFRNAAFVAAALTGTTAYRLVINNRAATDLYGAIGGPDEVITPAGRTITLSVSPGTGATGACGSPTAAPPIVNVHHLAIGGGGYDFLGDSSRRRVYVIEAAALPVTYACDTNSGTLTRYAGYALQSAQPGDPSAAPLSGASSIGRVADSVSACSATSTLGVQGSGLVTFDLTLSRDGETVRLVQQVQLDNSQ